MEQQNPPVEESIFNEADYSMEGYDKHVRRARTTLYVMAGLTVVSLFTLSPIDNIQKYIVTALTFIFAAVFAILGYWSKKQPFTAILAALIIYGSLITLSAILQPVTLLQGWYMKIGIILFLILGLRNAKEIRDRKNAFGKID
jgi:hypothetical protein